MKEVIALIVKKKQEFARLTIFEFLADRKIHWRQRLIFSPVLAPFALGLNDLNKYVLRESGSNNTIQELLNKHTYKESYYWHSCLENLEKLGLNQSVSYGDLRFLWGEETRKTRSLCSVLERLAFQAPPLQKLVLAEVLEVTTKVFFDAVLRVAMETQDSPRKEPAHFSGSCLRLENHRILNTTDICQVLSESQISDREWQQALELVEQVFDLVTEAMEELLENAQTNSCNTVLQVA